jgi:hypothetical protein
MGGFICTCRRQLTGWGLNKMTCTKLMFRIEACWNVQHKDPKDPHLCVSQNVDRWTAPFDRTKPLLWRLADSSKEKLSSSDSESSKLHSIEGKAIEASTCFEAFAKSPMSKLQDPVVGRERFKLFDEIIGCADMTLGALVCRIDRARAAVADMMCMYIVCLFVVVVLDFIRT